MGSVYGRLGFNFDTTQFNGADVLSPGVINYLDSSSINLSEWQINDLANTAVGGYYKNPYNDKITVLSVSLTGIILYANTEFYSYDNPDVANTMLLAATSAQNSLINFTTHTNNISGVTRTSDASLYPDLTSALSIGRQILSITNKTDAVQNNTPVLGNFTSLYIGNTFNLYTDTITKDYITLSNSFSGANSNISTETMNTIIYDIQSLQTLMDTRVNSDIVFYTNSYQIVQDYMTILQFSNLGASQNSLISIIGTDKLKKNLGL